MSFGSKHGSRAWLWGAVLLCSMIAVPFAVLFLPWLKPEWEMWQHLRAHVLPDVLTNTVLLVTGTVAITGVLGTSLAWLTTFCEFPGRRLLSGLLIAPLAFPSYVLAFIYLGLLGVTSPFASLWREATSIPLPEMRSVGGAVFVLSLSLYPYVYLVMRGAFKTQGWRAWEVAQSYGQKPRTFFLRVALPLARPWLGAALILVAMETLADFGTVATFVVDTFTTAIYKTWFAMFSPRGAAQLASLLILLSLLCLQLEGWAMRRQSFNAMGSAAVTPRRLTLSREQRYAATFFCGLVLSIGFVVPLVQLLFWAQRQWSFEWNERLWGYALNSVILGALTAVICTALALYFLLCQRFFPGRLTRMMQKLSGLGYAIPGSVLAVGIFIPSAAFDHVIASFGESMTGETWPMLLTGSAAVLFLGLSIRFLGVAKASIAGGLGRVSPHMDEAATVAGVRGFAMVRQVFLPMLKTSLWVGGILVFVDVVKEMPLTLMTRPMGWETLAVKIFELTSEGEWERAAVPALILLLAGFIPVGLLLREEMARE